MEDYIHNANRGDDVHVKLILELSCESLKENFQERDVHHSDRERKEAGTDLL